MLETLQERLQMEISANGPMPFEAFIESALYDVDYGFYATTGRAGGRRGDFVTSVEVGPLFAAIVADWLDQVWHDVGQPAQFHVSEVGAGVGTMFRGIDRASPRCGEALVYTLVERSASMRVAHQSLPGSSWRSSGELPADRQHVILANELLDNLAFGIAEYTADGWAPVQVTVRSGDLELAVDGPDTELVDLERLVPKAAVGCRVPVASAASDWVRQARRSADRVLVVDYGAPTAELAERDQAGWLRTYAEHTRGNDALAGVGQRDITHDVPIDQLPAADVQALQADWLRTHGLEQRVETARQTWAERGHIGDLQAIAARSAIGEAEALTDPTGLGAFIVLEWSA